MTVHLHLQKITLLSLLIAITICLDISTIHAQTDLIISEYVESNTNKCIEIFNPTSSNITLTGIYRLRVGYNGNPLTTLSNLNGIVASKGTYVVCSSSSSYSFDQSWGAAGPSGNDAIVLEKNMNPVDIFGNIGCDPGPEWNEGGQNTSNVTLVRKACQDNGVTSDPSDVGCPFPSLATEWIQYGPNDLSHLGTHDYLYTIHDVTPVGPSDCGSNDGSILMSADGFGVEYSIDGGASFQDDTAFTGLSAGDYNVIIRVASDHTCAYTETVTLSDRTPPIIMSTGEIDPSDCGINDGEIHLAATGSNLEYSIDDGINFGSSPDFGDLSGGTYDIVVRISGTSNCIDITSVTLIAPTPPSITEVTVDPTSDCGLDDGSISIAATGGPLQYSIDNGVTWSLSNTHTFLPPATYDIVVRNLTSPACNDQDIAIIFEPEPPLAMLDNIMASDCKGTATGSIVISSSGGSGTYSYQWEGPSLIGDVANATSLHSGIYHVTISDAVAPGCQDTLDNLFVGEPLSEPPVVMLNPQAEFCEQDPIYILPVVQDGFTGTWTGNGVSGGGFDPSGLVGEITLTFLPDAGQCARENTIEVSISPAVPPTLDAIEPMCNLDQPVKLPTVQDGLSGNWSGIGVEDNQFNPTGIVGFIDISFTPQGGQCAMDAQLTINVRDAVTPVLPAFSDQCQLNDPLELDSPVNSITGEWSGPGVTENNFNPDGLSGTIELQFSPDEGQCALTGYTEIEVVRPEAPVLEMQKEICINSSPFALNPLQDELIGLWSGPGVINNTFDSDGLTGEITLLFTPAASQCGLPASIDINLIQPPTLDFIRQEPDCTGEQNGSLEVLVNGGVKPLLFDWGIDGSGDFDDDEIITNLSAGSYEVSVKDQASCTVTTTAILSEPAKLQVIIVSTGESSTGAQDGTAEVMVTGGTGPFTFIWSTGSEERKILGLAPGSYSATVTDNRGCQDHETIVINPGSCLFTARVITTRVSCWGANNGTATIEVSDGIPPYSYRWMHDSLLNSPEVIDLRAGSYVVLVEDSAGCQFPLNFTINQPDPLISTLVSQDVSHEGAEDGQIIVSTQGGVAPYLYSWSNGSEVQDQSQLSPGEYILTTMDSAGCIHSSSTTINAPNCNIDFDLQFSSTVCFESMNGLASLSVKQGTPPYRFTWSHDSSIVDSVVYNLGAGQYEVGFTDANGCNISKQFSINEHPSLTIIPEITPATDVNVEDGAISVKAFGGRAPYTYQWSTGQTGPEQENLLPADYSVTVTDSNGCETVHLLTVGLADCLLEVEVAIDSVQCAGGNDGAARLMIIDDVQPLDITWSFDTTVHELSVSGLGPGKYEVIVSDAGNCMDTLPFEVYEPELLRIAFEARNETFLGAHDGQILTRGLGGSPPYQFRWNSGQKADSIGGLKPGTYIVTVEDSKGCMSIRSTKINAANCTLLSNVGVRDAICFGDSSGRARLDITSEALPVTTRWSHDTLLQGNLAENLSAGVYSVTITDQDLCQHVWPFVVEQPEPLGIRHVVTHQTLPGLADGSIEIMVSGGTPGYNLIWSDSTRGLRRTRLLPGVYEFTISDANNCILSDSVEILSSEICQLEIESSITASGCDSSGSVTLNLTGVRGEANVVWSKTEIPNTRVVQGLSAGRYWVTVRDEFCEVSDTFDVPVNDIEDVVFQIGQSLCDARKNTFKIISVKGGTDPYQLNLNGQSIQLTNEIILKPGTHNLRVNDSKGCVDNSVFMVEPASDIRLQRDTTIKLGEELTLFGQLPGPEDSFLFRWIERKGIICEQCRNITISPTATSKYIFEVEDGSGCRSRQEYNIRVDSRNLIYIPNAFTPNGDGLNDAFIVYDGLALIEEIVSLDIFDRRGMKIYQAKNLTTNEEAPDFTSIFQEVIGPQVYMYIIEIRFKQGYKQSIKGDFIIVK